jgi:hypothetical protein
MSHRRTTLTSAQPLGSRSPVLSHRHVQLSKSSFSLRYTAKSSGVSSQLSAQRRTVNPSHGILPFLGAHNIPSLSQRGTTHPTHGHTQLMGFLTPHRGTQRSFSVSERNHTPNSWDFSQVDSLSLCPGQCLTQL